MRENDRPSGRRGARRRRRCRTRGARCSTGRAAWPGSLPPPRRPPRRPARGPRCWLHSLGDRANFTGLVREAVSKPNFASRYAFESSCRDLHNALLCTAFGIHNRKLGGTALQSQFLSKISICQHFPRELYIANFLKFVVFRKGH